MTETLPRAARELIRAYLHMELGEKELPCPYFKNTHGVRGALRVRVGKGLPHEIIDEVCSFAHKERVDLDSLSVEQLRSFLVNHHLGVDCSGFVVHVLSVVDPHFFRHIKMGQGKRTVLVSLLPFIFQPVKNLSVRMLTSSDNARYITDLHTIVPGDLIRTRNGDHVLLVTEVTKEDERVTSFSYVHSTGYYGGGSGVRVGSIRFTRPDESLDRQEWDEVDCDNGMNYTHAGYLEGGEDSGVYRLKALRACK